MARNRLSKVIVVLITGCVAALAVSIIPPFLERQRLSSSRIPCATNLRDIGTALYSYSESDGGRFPKRLDELLGADWPMSVEKFKCAATGPPTVFVAPGAVTTELTAEDLVAHEPLSAHEG